MSIVSASFSSAFEGNISRTVFDVHHDLISQCVVSFIVGHDSIPVYLLECRTLNRENPVSNPTAVASNLWQV